MTLTLSKMIFFHKTVVGVFLSYKVSKVVEGECSALYLTIISLVWIDLCNAIW